MGTAPSGAQSLTPVRCTLGCENPKPSLTELALLEHGSYAGDPVSKVLLKPLTGTCWAGQKGTQDRLHLQAPLGCCEPPGACPCLSPPPSTGRTHQLRVHCSALGHPVVGDLTYGQAGGRDAQPFRMMLHAFYLRIPTRAERVEACTPDPFLPTLDACWSPHTLLQPLDQLVRALRAAPDPEPIDKDTCGPLPPHPTSPETEAQRASCLQWLSEWTLEPGH